MDKAEQKEKGDTRMKAFFVVITIITLAAVIYFSQHTPFDIRVLECLAVVVIHVTLAKKAKVL
jgi:hypothetical protein